MSFMSLTVKGLRKCHRWFTSSPLICGTICLYIKYPNPQHFLVHLIIFIRHIWYQSGNEKRKENHMLNITLCDIIVVKQHIATVYQIHSIRYMRTKIAKRLALEAGFLFQAPSTKRRSRKGGVNVSPPEQ